MARKKWKNPEDIIQPITKPEVYNRKQTYYTGQTTGLNFVTWVNHIFSYNEKQPQKSRYTDKEIITAIFKEFSPRLHRVRELKASPAIFGRHRSRYNKIQRPYLISLRYGYDRCPVHHYDAPIGLSRIRKKCFVWKIIDPRFFNLEELEYIRDLIEANDPFYSGCIYPPDDIIEQHPYGSVDMLVQDREIIPISELELQWYKV